jgi:hypothetical protein
VVLFALFAAADTAETPSLLKQAWKYSLPSSLSRFFSTPSTPVGYSLLIVGVTGRTFSSAVTRACWPYLSALGIIGYLRQAFPPFERTPLVSSPLQGGQPHRLVRSGDRALWAGCR